MPHLPRRATSRLVSPGLASCYHITQGCQDRRFLLRHAKDRRQYLKRLWEASRRYSVAVLNYMVNVSEMLHISLRCKDHRQWTMDYGPRETQTPQTALISEN